MRDRILFYLNGQRLEVSGDDVFLTLSDYLRKRRGLTGIKVVCAEGDCGSCTVLVGRICNEELHYSPVTSCIQILFQLDATHVITVEGLRDGDKLNPIQRAMVNCHGTQCGFCTPGFVVALHSLMTDGTPKTDETIRRGVTGNLCRCTGYDSIIKAAMSVDPGTIKSVGQIYNSTQMQTDLVTAAKEEVRIETASHRYFKPVTITNAAQYRQEHPDCTLIAGGTDLGVVYNKHLREIKHAMSLAGLESLRETWVTKDFLYIGGGCTLNTLQRLASEHIEELGRFMEQFGSPLIRNAGTVAGNLMTGSPIGDTLPAMMALGAEIELTGMVGKRRVPVDQFYTGYRQTLLAGDELLTGVHIPLLKQNQSIKLYKVSRRKDLDISTFGAAIWMQCEADKLVDIRIFFGGVGPTVMRMTDAEAILKGQLATLQNFERAAEAARRAVKPISDVRGSADYRRTLAGNILMKFWHEAFCGVNVGGLELA